MLKEPPGCWQPARIGLRRRRCGPYPAGQPGPRAAPASRECRGTLREPRPAEDGAPSRLWSSSAMLGPLMVFLAVSPRTLAKDPIDLEGQPQLLQLQALSRASGESESARRAQRKVRRCTEKEEGGEGPNHRMAETAQKGSKGAHQPSNQATISRVSICPTLAGCQHAPTLNRDCNQRTFAHHQSPDCGDL